MTGSEKAAATAEMLSLDWPKMKSKQSSARLWTSFPIQLNG